MIECKGRTQTGLLFKDAIKQSEEFGNGFYIREYVESYITQNLKSDYDFVSNFDAEELLRTINGYFIGTGLTNDTTLEELLTVTNYEKHFKSKYGIENCNKELLKATDKFTDFIDDLTKGVKNKQAFLWAINEYIVNQDKSTVHTILHV